MDEKKDISSSPAPTPSPLASKLPSSSAPMPSDAASPTQGGHVGNVDGRVEVLDIEGRGRGDDDDKALEAGRKELKGTMESRLVWKLDWLIMPLSAIFYLFAYLDRGNIGNAKLQGLQTDVLGSSSQHYDTAVSVYFASYIIFQVPANLAVKRFPPSKWIGSCAIAWGTISVLQTAATNPAGLYVLRIMLGLAEAGFTSAMLLYFSYFYRRDEMGMRTAIYVSSAASAGAFGGVIAYGTALINSHVANWKILFFVEGFPTILVGFIALFLLPDRPETTRWLTAEEKVLAIQRIGRETAVDKAGYVDKKQIWPAFKEPKIYLQGLAFMGANVALSSINAFLPSIIKTLGWSSAKAQLMTVPPYACAFVVMFINAWFSDRWRTRGWSIAAFATVAMAGYIILDTVHYNNHVRYFATFLITLGTYPTIPTIVSWASNNALTETQRAVAIGTTVSVGQVGGIIGAFIYHDNDAPIWTIGFTVCAVFAFLVVAVAIVLHFWYQHENRIKDRRALGEGDVDAGLEAGKVGGEMAAVKEAKFR